MSATSHAVSASDHGHAGDDHESSKFQIYVQIAMLLAVITGIEIVCVYLPFAKWLIVTTLVVLSTVKFMFVIFYFMHLRWDKPFCTILFFIGLVLAGGTMWGLLTIFAAEASLPLPA
jgi:cytochrome c oxidase subunit IV